MRKSESSTSKRVQLFGASPLDTGEDGRIPAGSFFSPNIPSDSPRTPGGRSWEQEQGGNSAPQSGSKHGGNHETI